MRGWRSRRRPWLRAQRAWGWRRGGGGGGFAPAYVPLRSLDARLAVAQATVASRTEALRLARSRARVGYTSDLELRQAESEYEGSTQVESQLALAVTRQENAIRLLLGDNPGDV